MPDVTIIVSSVTPMNNKMRADGLVYVAPNHGPYSWMCEHDWGEIAININKTMRDEAVAVAEANGHNISPSDKKTLFAAAQDANA